HRGRRRGHRSEGGGDGGDRVSGLSSFFISRSVKARHLRGRWRLALGERSGLQVGIENRRHAFEDLDRQCRGELEAFGRAARYVRGQRAVMVVADVEHESGGAVDRLGREHASAGTEAFDAVVTC
nr:hypothetical protein [Tanacetum cinerariifolium]